jgi:HrpA-like RNA helicase
VLQILALGGGDPRSFDFLDPPPAESLEAAVQSLVSHEAVRARPSFLAGGREHLGLTPLGEVRCEKAHAPAGLLDLFEYVHVSGR